ncbi:MAG: A/G-specific adenine glycosylase [Lachnospiraceae bacterium]|nr:A/G-specific adenine glycosylase [Lachnospiraceae bacterium]
MEHLEKKIVPALLRWYDYNARILPWRSEPTPYRVWISENMLQQTRVEAVKPYYDRFMETLPNVKALAEVEDDKLMKLWEGLGYYNRARNLKAAAQTIMDQFGGELPADYDALLTLKGIGEYTAGAIGSIAYQLPVPAVDGNVMRVVARLLANGDDVLKPATKRWMTKELLDILPKDRPGDFNQALMELGATVCLPNGAPLCGNCPWDTVCKAHKQGNELDYPFKQPKKPRKIEQKKVYLLEYEGKYALRKRPSKGLLAGLWEFPNMSCGEKVEKRDEFLLKWQELSDEADEMEKLGKGKHIFSHIEWHMTGYHVLLKAKPEEKNLVWVSKEEMKEEYAVPAAFEFMKDFILAEEE